VLISLIRREPVVLAGTVLPFLTVVLTAFGVHATPVQTAAIATAVTAVFGIVSAALVQPVSIAVIHSGLATLLVAAGAFGLHLTPAQIAILTGAAVTVLGSLLREKVSPVAGTRPSP
jgi:hypothetical protein